MSESIQQAITAARSLSPEVRAILAVESDAEGQALLKRIGESVQALIARHRMTPAFWLEVATATPARQQAEAKPAPVAPEKNEQPTAMVAAPRVTSRRTNGHVHVHPETLDAARALEQARTLKARDTLGRITTLGDKRLAELLAERGTKCSPATLFNIRALEKAHFPVSATTAAEVEKALRALIAELTAKPEPTPPDGGGREWVSGFEPLESTKPEREKVSDEVRALQALASGCMWPNVLAARFGWSEGYTRQLVDRLSGQGRVKKDGPGKVYITHLGRKATLEAAA